MTISKSKSLLEQVLWHLRNAKPVELKDGTEIGFNMIHVCHTIGYDFTEHECGTTGCIAGWTLALSGRYPTRKQLRQQDDRSLAGVFEDAAELLGLPYLEAYNLFQGYTLDKGFRASPDEAADALEALARRYNLLGVAQSGH